MAPERSISGKNGLLIGGEKQLPRGLNLPLEDPLGRVPLLLRPPLVFRQNGVNHALPRTKLGSPDRRLPPIPRRQRILQHLAYRLPRQPKLPGHRPPALALDNNRPPHRA